MNSRGTASGVVELTRDASGEYKTRRERSPTFVSNLLQSLYSQTGLSCGIPDLVLWKNQEQTARFIEVKCPHGDEPSEEQDTFLGAIRARGYSALVIEWEFVS